MKDEQLHYDCILPHYIFYFKHTHETNSLFIIGGKVPDIFFDDNVRRIG